MQTKCGKCHEPLDWEPDLAPFTVKDGKIIEYCHKCWEAVHAGNRDTSVGRLERRSRLD